MSDRKLVTIVLTGSVALAVLLALPGCGTAEAKPLDVTYYYLPG